MGALDVIRRPVAALIREYTGSERVFAAGFDPFGRAIEWFRNGEPRAVTDLSEVSPARMYRTQPYLRTVVSFLARNTAQLGLHVYERVGDNDRRRDHGSPLAMLLAAPNDSMSAFDLVFALVVDKCLYDAAYWAVVSDSTRPSGWRVERLPVPWVAPRGAGLWVEDEYVVTPPGAPGVVLPRTDVWSLRGIHPSDPRLGSPTVIALRDALQEQIEASRYRRSVWERGGKVSAVIKRPANAPRWTDGQRNAFREDWYAKFTGNGSGIGGTPILEDGMSLERVDFSASDQQWAEGMKLSMALVASAYHVNPVMVGQLENASLANVREFRRMLYGETLGPLMAEIEARINTFLLPMLGMDPSRFYAEFNIQEKLQGSFEEQAYAFQAAVGRPWMTANEARGRVNLPALDGDANGIVTPLNVVVGGQASPVDSGSQNRTPKAVGPVVPTGVDADPASLALFQARQRAVCASRKGAGDPQWFDFDRWDAELAQDLGIDPSEAHAINEALRAQMEEV